MVTTNKKNVLYFIYSTLVYAAYLYGTGVIPLYIKSPLRFFSYLLILTLFLITVSKSDFKISKKLILPVSLLLAYSGSLGIVILIHFPLFNAINRIIYYCISYFLLFYVVIHLLNWFSLSNLLKPFMISSILIIFSSLAVYLGWQPKFYSHNIDGLEQVLSLKYGSKTSAFSGIYLNQNTFGTTLLISFISIYSKIIILKKEYVTRIFSFILYLSLALTVVFIFLTLSRGVVGAMLLIMSLYIIRNTKKKSGLLIIASSVFLLAIIAFQFQEYLSLLLNRVETSGTSSRTVIWSDAIKVFLNNPLIGVGEYQYYSFITGANYNAHNVYLDSLASYGIFTSTFWFSWLLIGIIGCTRKYFSKNHSLLDKLDIFIASSLIGVLIHQAVESHIQDTLNTLTFLSIIIISYLICNRSLLRFYEHNE